MRIPAHWLDEQRALRWVTWGAMLFGPCVLYFLVVGLWLDEKSPLYGGLSWSLYGALAGAVIGLSGWLQLLVIRLLRIGR